MGKTTRLTYIFVKEAFEKEGYTLLSTKYINSYTKLDYMCDNGHKHSTRFDHFKDKHRCPICDDIKRSGKGNHNYKGGVSKNNLPLYGTFASQLEKYQSVHKIKQNGLDLLGVECTYCSNIFVPKTQQVQRKLIAIKFTNKGEHNLYCSEKCKQVCPTYHKKVYPEGQNPRKDVRPLQKQWSEMVKERDNYTCQKCGAKNKVMYAHHIDPVINNPIESADIDNGITLCKKCDKLAHQTVGCSYSELRC